jgi:Domain of unknown function (DUF4190)
MTQGNDYPGSGYGQQPQQPGGYPPPPPGAPGQYGGYPQQYAPQPPAQGTNTMAILALVFAFVFAPLGIVFGIMGRKQIARTGEGGDGLALAGLIVGSLFTLLGVIYIIFVITAISAAMSSYPG